MIQEFKVEDEILVTKISNATEQSIVYKKESSKTDIQIHFTTQGSIELQFSNKYTLNVKENHSMLLFNPLQDLPINASIPPEANYILMVIPIKVFHSFFSKVAGLIHFMDKEENYKKYYSEKELSPYELVILTQFFGFKLNNSLPLLYLKSKILELLSIYFSSDENLYQACPFLSDKKNVEKIKKVKQILIEQMEESPTLAELASKVSLSVSRLKDGFKKVYGESVYQFLLNYKLEYARKLLLSKKYNVSEVGYKVGYSTSGHFITAFKKKFGITPKKYLLSAII